jgi:hypothetical protein
MASALNPAIESYSFDGETVAAAGAAALRRVKTLAETAPQGRLFGAIVTMVETSALAADAFEKASLAELRRETASANAHIARGKTLVQSLAAVVGSSEPATPLPAFMRRR